MNIPFNEASLHEDFTSGKSPIIHNNIITDFTLLLHNLLKKHILEFILTDSDFSFYGIPLIISWLNNQNTDKEYKRILANMLANHIQNTSVQNSLNISVDENIYPSKGAFYAHSSQKFYMLSCKTHFFWKQDYCIIPHSDVKIYQIQSADADYLLDIYRKEIKDQIKTGKELLNNWEKLFPNLIKCDSIDECLRFENDLDRIKAYLDKLSAFQKYFAAKTRSYMASDLPFYGLTAASTEGKSTKNKPLCQKEHEYILPNGEKKNFWNHLKFNVKRIPLRIHFLPKDLNTCYIGYIGTHLSISGESH